MTESASLADTDTSIEMTIVSIEEQREVALKVVFGICTVITVGLLAVFIYDRMSVEKEKQKIQIQQ